MHAGAVQVFLSYFDNYSFCLTIFFIWKITANTYVKLSIFQKHSHTRRYYYVQCYYKRNLLQFNENCAVYFDLKISCNLSKHLYLAARLLLLRIKLHTYFSRRMETFPDDEVNNNPT